MKIQDKVLHIDLGETIPTDIEQKIRAREISQIYFDVSAVQDKVADSDAIFNAASALHKVAASTGILSEPVVVGPFTRQDHVLIRKLCLDLIRISSFPFEEYMRIVNQVNDPPQQHVRRNVPGHGL